MDKPIKSPFAPANVSDEQLQKIKEMIGCECVFIAVSNDNTACNHENCQGHPIHVNKVGFTDEQILGLAHYIIDEDEE